MPLKTKSLRAKYMVVWRNKRYFKGICTECSKSSGQFTRCFEHRIRRAASQKEWRRKHAITQSPC